MSRKRFHTLFLVRSLPWPMNAGARLRDYQNICVLGEYGKVSVLSVHESVVSEKPGHPWIHKWQSLDSLLLEDPPPFPNSERPLSMKWWTNPLGHPSDREWHPFRHEVLRRYVHKENVDLVVVEDACLWRYAEDLSSTCGVIVDCHNIQGELDREVAKGLPEESREFQARLLVAASNMDEAHRRFINSSFMVCSKRDKERLSTLGIEQDRIFVVHNVVDPETERNKKISISPLIENIEGPIILFAGVMNYPPNSRAARKLVSTILPLVTEEVPDVSLVLAGRDPTPELLTLAHSIDNVYITGAVLDMSPYFDLATTLCAPLDEGGGTRFKILEAFKHHLPVVTSEKGCEGLSVKDGSELLLAEEPEACAQKVIQLIRDKKLRKRLGENGYSLLKKRYIPTVIVPQIREVVDSHLKRYALAS